MTQTTTTDSSRRDILFRFVLSVFVLAGAGFFFIGGVSLVPDSPAGAGLGYASVSYTHLTLPTILLV